VAISIPRDSFVPIAGTRGTHKINSAYGRALQDAEKAMTAQGVSGAELDRRGREAGRSALVATVEALTGVQIDHFAEINLAGFVELTEAIGGVPVCLNAAVRDSYSGVDLPAGQQTITGPTALAFVRQRHGLEGGDLDRIARQQAYIAGIAQRLQSAGTLTDPGRLARLVGVVTRHVVIDRGWNLEQAMSQLGRLSGDAVQIDQDAVRAFVGRLVLGPPPSGPATTTGPQSTAPSTAQSAGTTRTTSPRTSVPSTATTAPQVITADGVPCVD